MFQSFTHALLWVSRLQVGLCTAACLGLLTLCHAALGVEPSESLLPKSTVGYVSAPNVPELVESWNKTQLGRLLKDPAFDAFGEDLRRQLQEKWSQQHARLGLTLDDLRGLSSGELSLALIRAADDKAAVAVLADVTGNAERAQAAIDKASESLIQQGAKKSQQQVAGTTLTVFETAPKGERKQVQQVVYFIKDGLLGAASDLAVATDLVKSAGGRQSDSLASLPAYQAVMERVRKDPTELNPHVRWFVDPFGFAEAIRTWAGPRRGGETDYLRALKNQGFTAVQGVGGFVNFAAGPYGMLHRTYIHAPPPYKLAMRMLSFPNAGDFTPQSWVSRDVATYMSFQMDLQNAFDHFGSLFDELMGEEGVWEDTLKSVEIDEEGPRISIRKDLVAHLGQRLTVLTDYKLPIAPTSQRRLLAIEVKDPDALAKSVAKAMEGDPLVIKRKVGDYEVWEIVAEENRAPPEVEIPERPRPGADSDADQDREADQDDAELAAVKVPNAAVTVAKGHLFVASHMALLETVLADIEQREQLASDVDYRLVEAEFERLDATATSARSFSRTDEQFRTTYEMFQQGKLPETDTFFARLVNTILGEEKEGITRKPRLDGSKLPQYEVVRRYLGPAGSYVVSEDQGWFIVGFTLGRETPLAGGIAPQETKSR